MTVHFSFLPLSFFLAAMLVLTGCDKSEHRPVQEQKQSHQEISDAVDLTQLCKNIHKEMNDINAQRTTLALEQINQDLKVCLPLVQPDEQLALLKLSTQMYRNFLTVERTPQQAKAFHQYAFDMAQHPTIQQSHFEQFTLRDQYLLKHQGQAYIELFDAGADSLIYRRSPQYLAIIFAPYMPEAEKVFIEHLAQQNMQQTLRDGALIISAQEVTERALFWEGYVRDYPKSRYIQDARYLQKLYAIFLFKGTPKTSVSENYRDKSSVTPDNLAEIEALTQLKNSALADQARKFIQFVQMSDADRRQPPAAASPSVQLTQYLQLNTEVLKDKRDCFSDAVCLSS